MKTKINSLILGLIEFLTIFAILVIFIVYCIAVILLRITSILVFNPYFEIRNTVIDLINAYREFMYHIEETMKEFDEDEQ